MSTFEAFAFADLATSWRKGWQLLSQVWLGLRSGAREFVETSRKVQREVWRLFDNGDDGDPGAFA
ncbi:MAG: hypothetical protein AB1705_17860 [Verrucomicrobiota bacterium]